LENPHPLLEEGERPFYRGVRKTFSKDELETLYEDFEALIQSLPSRLFHISVPSYVATIAQWRRDMDAVPQRREAFFKQHMANANMIMEKALMIDKAVRAQARKEKEIKNNNRESRKQFFKDCAEIDLPDVPAEVVKISRPFLAAIKIGKDGGSKRLWALLKPKIRKEWNTFYTEGMKKAMWEHNAVQEERKRRDATVALAIEEVFAAEEESPVDEQILSRERC
jgi:hypothetical protein